MILMGTGGPLERAMALDDGAEDCLTKPVKTEFIARIRAALLQTQTTIHSFEQSQRLSCEELSIDR